MQQHGSKYFAHRSPYPHPPPTPTLWTLDMEYLCTVKPVLSGHSKEDHRVLRDR